MKITTKTGDKGETSLFGGRRVSKGSVFVELVGGLDELQAVVGWCAVGTCEQASEEVGVSVGLSQNCPANCMTKSEKEREKGLTAVELLNRIQDHLYRIMSVVGFEMKCPGNIKPIGEEDVAVLEKYVEESQGKVADLGGFVRPGGSEAAARLHIARTVCRRVEREFVRATAEPGLGTGVAGAMLQYLNRLSDVLFVMAYDEATPD